MLKRREKATPTWFTSVDIAGAERRVFAYSWWKSQCWLKAPVFLALYAPVMSTDMSQVAVTLSSLLFNIFYQCNTESEVSRCHTILSHLSIYFTFSFYQYSHHNRLSTFVFIFSTCLHDKLFLRRCHYHPSLLIFIKIT